MGLSYENNIVYIIRLKIHILPGRSMQMTDLNNNAFIDDASQYGRKTKPVPVPEKNIGIDTNNSFFADIIDAGESGQLDISKLESFTQISQSRE